VDVDGVGGCAQNVTNPSDRAIGAEHGGGRTLCAGQAGGDNKRDHGGEHAVAKPLDEGRVPRIGPGGAERELEEAGLAKPRSAAAALANC